MWFTILLMAVAVSLEPFRIGMTAVMLNRPRPMLQLLAFLCGGFVMGLSVGLVVLFALGSVLSHVLPDDHASTLPRVQIVLGALALLAAAVVASGVVGRIRNRPRQAEETGTPARWRRLLRSTSLWVAVVAGLGIALPSVDYLAALAVIAASGASAAVQVIALVTFTIVAFAFVEVPLIAYLVAPQRTRQLVGALDVWVRARSRLEVAALLAVVGAVLLVVGVATH